MKALKKQFKQFLKLMDSPQEGYMLPSEVSEKMRKYWFEL